MSARIIVAALPDELNHAPIPFDIPVIYTGVGKLNAAYALMQGIAKYQPKEIINFGTVGRVSRQVSGLVEVADVIQRDMDAQPLCARGVTPYDETLNRFSSSFEGVRCATGDSFVRETDEWLVAQGVDVVDMELFALAFICQKYNIPWRSFKFITDDTDSQSGEDWQSRVHHGRELFLTKLASLL